MDGKGGCGGGGGYSSEDPEVRKGPWTMEEDLILINYIANHGEGVWNNIAKCAGLKRTGKSCRLRWLNYLRPDVRRGNITADEEMLIIELQSRWGNRWSKIAKQMPGRTDNEIKNYWRTRIQKRFKLAEMSGCGGGGSSSETGTTYQQSPDCGSMSDTVPMILEASSGVTPHMGCGMDAMDASCSAQSSSMYHHGSCSNSAFMSGGYYGSGGGGGGVSGMVEDLWDVDEMWSMHQLLDAANRDN